MSKKIDFDVSNKIIKTNESNKNNDFNKINDYDLQVTFLTNEYIKNNIQILANANNLTLKEMWNKALLEYIEDNKDTIDILKKLQSK